MLVKIQFTASLADEATRNVLQFQFPIFPFSFCISSPPPHTSPFLCFVPIVCAIIQIYAKYNTLLATFWHPLDSALSIRLVELICFDCPVDPAPLPLPPPSHPATRMFTLLSVKSTVNSKCHHTTSCHLPLSLSLSLLPLPLAMRAFCGSRLAEAKSSWGCHCDRLLSSGKGKVFSASN